MEIIILALGIIGWLMVLTYVTSKIFARKFPHLAQAIKEDTQYGYQAN